MTDKTEINRQKMKILLGLRGFSIIKLDDTRAMWKINSENSVTIDVTFPADMWEVKHKGKTSNNWKKDPAVPVSTRGMLEVLENDFVKACEEAAMNGWHDEGSGESGEPEQKEPEPEKAEVVDDIEEKNRRERDANIKKTEDVDAKLIKTLGNLLTGITDKGFERTKAGVM